MYQLIFRVSRKDEMRHPTGRVLEGPDGLRYRPPLEAEPPKKDRRGVSRHGQAVKASSSLVVGFAWINTVATVIVG